MRLVGNRLIFHDLAVVAGTRLALDAVRVGAASGLRRNTIAGARDATISTLALLVLVAS